MYLVAPFSWEHHLVYLLPSILVLLNSHSSSRLAPKLMFYALCVASAVMISMPCLFQFKFYAVVVLWVLCVFAIGNKDIELVHKTY